MIQVLCFGATFVAEHLSEGLLFTGRRVCLISAERDD